MLGKVSAKFLAGLLSGLLILTLVGCAGNSNTPKDSKPAKTATTEKQGGKATDDQVEELLIHMFDSEHPAQPLREDSPVLNEIYKQKKVKMKFELATGDNYDEKKNTLLATNNIPEVMRVYPEDLNDYAGTGIFLSISDYMDEYMPNFKALYESDPEIKKLTVDGKLYGLPKLAQYQMSGIHGPMIRSDVLKDLGLEMPDSFADLYTVLQTFKQTYPDIYPIANRNGTRNLLEKWSYALGSGFDMYYDYDLNGGTYVFGPATEQFKDVLLYMNKLYTEKLLDPDYATTTAQTWREKLSSGRSLFYYDNYSFGVVFNNVLQAENPASQFDLVPPMQNDQGVRRSLRWSDHWLEDVYVISSKVKNPEKILTFFDWLYSEEGADLTNYGIAGEHYTKVDGVNIIKEEVINKYKDKEDPAREMQGELGTGFLGMAFYVDERPLEISSPPDLVRWGEEVVKYGQYMKPEATDPPFNKEEIERLRTIRSQVDTLVDQEMDKFILGIRSLDDYDQFITELQNKGTIEMEQIYNAALARLN